MVKSCNVQPALRQLGVGVGVGVGGGRCHLGGGGGVDVGCGEEEALEMFGLCEDLRL